jgi:anthranilate phosphoribosyltransferase
MKDTGGDAPATADLKPYLAKLAEGARFTEEEAEAAFAAIMGGGATAAQIGAFLMGLRQRGETVAEITGAARVMRAKAARVAAPPGTIDTCGTGGDGSNTLNISTAVALTVAACGVTVAKHGNRAISSRTGTADVLAALGVNIDATPAVVEDCIRIAGIGFLFAPRFHSATRHVASVRQELGVRTIFNLLGPLSNPAGAARQLVGVFAKQWVVPLAETLGRLGSEKAWVVHGSDGLDEITTTGATTVAEICRDRAGSYAVSTFEVTPEDIGVKRAASADLKGADAAHNAAALHTLLHGRGGPYRDIVVLNSAAALVIAGKAVSLREGASAALEAIVSGKAAKTLATLVAVSNGKAP